MVRRSDIQLLAIAACGGAPAKGAGEREGGGGDRESRQAGVRAGPQQDPGQARGGRLGRAPPILTERVAPGRAMDVVWGLSDGRVSR